MGGFKKLLLQALKFLCISGIGWLIDFSVYVMLHKFVGNILVLNVLSHSFDACNMISMLCGVTFVFFVSTRKTFALNLKRFSLRTKYFIYVSYQLFALILVSYVIGVFTNFFVGADIAAYLAENSMFTSGALSKAVLFFLKPEISAKICVTPFTMVMNFIFMKLLTEFV